MRTECYICEPPAFVAITVCVDVPCEDVRYEGSLSSSESGAWDWVLLGQMTGSDAVWAAGEQLVDETPVPGDESRACAHGGCVDDAPRSRPPKLELADVFRRYGGSLGPMSAHTRRTIGALSRCRTPALGSHRRICQACGYAEDAPNSCRNRHCPKCQGLDETRWLNRMMEDVLPVPYHHLVFTASHELDVFFRVAPEVTYQIFFTAVAETLQEVAARPSNLGAKIGFTAILHTWNQRLLRHVHLHCIVPGGGLSEGGKRWVRAKPNFLFSVKVLSLVFRGKLLQALERASESGRIPIPPKEAAEALRRAAVKPWEVYSKPTMGGPEQVLRYLGRYTHRIAISNSRLVSLENDQVTFRWRDRSDGNQVKLMKLDGVEFCQRFLQHIVPPGFHRIRHYGLLSNAIRKEAVALCRERLGEPAPTRSESADEPWWQMFERVTGRPLPKCPRCGEGVMVHEGGFRAPPRRRGAAPVIRPPPQATVGVM